MSYGILTCETYHALNRLKANGLLLIQRVIRNRKGMAVGRRRREHKKVLIGIKKGKNTVRMY